MRVLCLGAGGFIGCHLAKKLLDEGHNVVGVDNHDDKVKDFLDHPAFEWHEDDICRADYDMDAVVQDADLVIDLIAYANPGIYVLRPLEVFHLNFTENLKIAEACVRHNKRLIQFSSCEVYGKTMAAIAPDKLKDPEDPELATFAEDESALIMGPVTKHRWIYACAKQLLERVLHAYGLENKLNYSIIRPFNFIGPKIDYLPMETDGVPRVFSYFMEALISGTEMQLVDGGYRRRCYTYIDDAIEWIYQIVENKNGVCDKQIFNVGSPYNEVTIRQVAEEMLDIYKEEFAPEGAKLPQIVDISGEEFYGEGYEDSDRRIPDTRKLDTLLDWQPKWRLRELLRETMAYYVEQFKDQIQAKN